MFCSQYSKHMFYPMVSKLAHLQLPETRLRNQMKKYHVLSNLCQETVPFKSSNSGLRHRDWDGR